VTLPFFLNFPNLTPSGRPPVLFRPYSPRFRLVTLSPLFRYPFFFFFFFCPLSDQKLVRFLSPLASPPSPIILIPVCIFVRPFLLLAPPPPLFITPPLFPPTRFFHPIWTYVRLPPLVSFALFCLTRIFSSLPVAFASRFPPL